MISYKSMISNVTKNHYYSSIENRSFILFLMYQIRYQIGKFTIHPGSPIHYSPFLKCNLLCIEKIGPYSLIVEPHIHPHICQSIATKCLVLMMVTSVNEKIQLLIICHDESLC